METNKELDIARFIVEKTNCNLFLTGKAGTGKTTFLRDVKKYTKKKHVLLAPTGVAAVNAGGMTIHSFFQFAFGPYVKGVHVPESSFHLRREKLEMIQALELIIIDEISMVRADMLDHINDELQRIRRNRNPFGGVQLLMVGDLQQLPPVCSSDEENILAARYSSPYFFDSLALRSSSYYCIELKSIFRQTDQSFIDILNKARDGMMTWQDIEKLNSRYIPNFIPPQGENYIRLVTHNYQADNINNEEMSKLPGREHIFDAVVSSAFPKDSYPTSEHLSLKQNAQVMFIKNDPDKRFVNGTLGVVEAVKEHSVSVRLSESKKLIDVVPVSWESIRYKLNEQTQKIEAEVKGSFKQYPLKTAWAITIHKSQGLTFDKAEINVSKAFSPGQAYVALSRCKSLEGIVMSARVSNYVFMTDQLVNNYMKSVIRDTDALAQEINYEFFDYERPVPKPEAAAVEPAQKTGPTEVTNANIYEALRNWRYGKAMQMGIPAYCIISNKAMTCIANALPENNDELLCLFGIGPKTVEQFGEEILSTVRDNRDSSNTRTEAIAPEQPRRKRDNAPGMPKIPTHEISFQMFKDGKSIPEIAAERGLVEGTILSHLSRYVASGELDVHRFISDEKLNKVAGYKVEHPDVSTMKEIFEFFEESISYGEIRMALAYLDNNQFPQN